LLDEFNKSDGLRGRDHFILEDPAKGRRATATNIERVTAANVDNEDLLAINVSDSIYEHLQGQDD
jgi:hypothetical protein